MDADRLIEEYELRDSFTPTSRRIGEESRSLVREFQSVERAVHQLNRAFESIHRPDLAASGASASGGLSGPSGGRGGRRGGGGGGGLLGGFSGASDALSGMAGGGGGGGLVGGLIGGFSHLMGIVGSAIQLFEVFGVTLSNPVTLAIGLVVAGFMALTSGLKMVLGGVQAFVGMGVDLIRGFATAVVNTVQIVIGVFESLVSGIMNAAMSIVDAVEGIIDTIKNVTIAVAGMAAAAAAGFIAFATSALKAYQEMDSLKRGLTSVMGSAELAADEILRLKEVAKLPGLGLREAIEGSVNLQAAGLSADRARAALMAFGNALATVGKGKANLDLVTLALTQISAKGRAMGDDIRQIQNQVPQFRKAIKDAFGTTDPQELEAMGIDADTFIDKIVEQLNRLPKVTGGIQNTFENLEDTWFQVLVKLGDAFSKVVLPVVDALGSALQNLADSGVFDRIGKMIADWVAQIDWVNVLQQALAGLIATLISLPEIFAAIKQAAIREWGAIGKLWSGLVPLAMKEWGSLGTFFDSFVKAFKSEMLALKTFFSDLIQFVEQGFLALLKTLLIVAPIIISVFGPILATLTALGLAVGGFVVNLAAIPVAIAAITGAFDGAIQSGKQLEGSWNRLTNITSNNWQQLSTDAKTLGTDTASNLNDLIGSVQNFGKESADNASDAIQDIGNTWRGNFNQILGIIRQPAPQTDPNGQSPGMAQAKDPAIAPLNQIADNTFRIARATDEMLELQNFALGGGPRAKLGLSRADMYMARESMDITGDPSSRPALPHPIDQAPEMMGVGHGGLREVLSGGNPSLRINVSDADEDFRRLVGKVAMGLIEGIASSSIGLGPTLTRNIAAQS